MSKDTFYFSHDYNSRNDEKIKFLLRKHGFIGYGLFWAIIEDLYNNANALRTDYEGIAYDFRVGISIIESIIKDFDLFVFEGDTFGSLSVQKRIDERDSKSVKARESAHKRWTNANAMQSQCEGNAIKEIKGKEIKGKEIKGKEIKVDSKTEFINKLQQHKDILGSEYDNFVMYWTEPNKNGKLRFEEQKFFDINRRILTWNKNTIKYGTDKSATAASTKRMSNLKEWVGV